MNQRYRGTMPHVEEASAGTQANVDSVARNKTLRSLDNQLAGADYHAEAGRKREAEITLDAARPFVEELAVLAKAGKTAFAEACSRCGVDVPPDEPSSEAVELGQVASLLAPHCEGMTPTEATEHLVNSILKTNEDHKRLIETMNSITEAVRPHDTGKGTVGTIQALAETASGSSEKLQSILAKLESLRADPNESAEATLDRITDLAKHAAETVEHDEPVAVVKDEQPETTKGETTVPVNVDTPAEPDDPGKGKQKSKL